MRIGNYVVRPDSNCWIVAEMRLRTDDDGNPTGEEYESGVQYPGRFDQALRNVLDRMARAGITPDDSLSDAVATVAHLYRTIGQSE